MRSNKFKESEVFNKLNSEKNLYEPLVISDIIRMKSLDSAEIDGMINLNYRGRVISLAIEIKNRTAPQVIETGIVKLLRLSNDLKYKDNILTLLVPYLSEKIVASLKSANLSGLDLNGNYYLVTNDFIAIRLDRKNQYKESAYIKNIYSRNSSIVSRFLLSENISYRRVSNIYEGIKKLNGNIVLSTVSKVLKSLEEELIISREKNIIEVIQPLKLINNLKENYIAPLPQRIFKLNVSKNKPGIIKLMNKIFNNNWIFSGESSAEFYTSTTPSKSYTVFAKGDYKTDLLEEYVSTRFYNCTVFILQPNEYYVFFNSQKNKASKIQTVLELSQLGKREKEIAKDIEKDILDEFTK